MEDELVEHLEELGWAGLAIGLGWVAYKFADLVYRMLSTRAKKPKDEDATSDPEIIVHTGDIKRLDGAQEQLRKDVERLKDEMREMASTVQTLAVAVARGEEISKKQDLGLELLKSIAEQAGVIGATRRRINGGTEKSSADHRKDLLGEE